MIPQLKMKLRCVTFGKEQFAELVVILSKETALFEEEPVATHVERLFSDTRPPTVVEKRGMELDSKRTELARLTANHEVCIRRLRDRRKPRTEQQRRSEKIRR